MTRFHECGMRMLATTELQPLFEEVAFQPRLPAEICAGPRFPMPGISGCKVEWFQSLRFAERWSRELLAHSQLVLRRTNIALEREIAERKQVETAERENFERQVTGNRSARRIDQAYAKSRSPRSHESGLAEFVGAIVDVTGQRLAEETLGKKRGEPS